MTDRLDLLRQWTRSQLDWPVTELAPASSDASFRRYFRICHGSDSFILMDAPPGQEDCRPFIHVSSLMLQLGLHVPEVLASDLEQGFLLLSDLGSHCYMEALDDSPVDRLYGDAMGALLALQSCVTPDCGLPDYDRDLLLAEMGLFRDWLLGRHLGIELDTSQTAELNACFDRLADSALAQPQVCVHRDYHSRNLMVCDQHNPGILDFQDAVIGPVTYDLVSLLRDCYIRWPRERVEDWVSGYYELALQCGILRPDQGSEADFLRWFDWMGVQRHLKAAGIFARLKHRDGKPGYIADIPRTLGYVSEVCASYPELAQVGELAGRVVEAL
jgi:aminoglycoside/choline kinase family phosphotransferase